MTTPKNDDEALCLTVAEVGKELYENRIRLSNGHPAASIEMAIRALQSAYERALNHYQTIDNIDLDAMPYKWASRPPLPSGAIQSERMQKYACSLETDLKGATFSAWLTRMPTAFETQIFDRTELQRWLEANGEVSSYRFDGVKADTNVPASATILATATVGAVGALGGTMKVWTPERKEDARAMRDELRGQGNKAFAANTAAFFGVSAKRLRDVLNDKPKKAPGKKAKGVWDV